MRNDKMTGSVWSV